MTMHIPSLNRPAYPSERTRMQPTPPSPELVSKISSLYQNTQQAMERVNILLTHTHIDQIKLDVVTAHASVLVALLNLLIADTLKNKPESAADKPTPLDITLKAREAVDNLFRGKSEEKLLEIRQITDTVLSTLRKEGIV